MSNFWATAVLALPSKRLQAPVDPGCELFQTLLARGASIASDS